MRTRLFSAAALAAALVLGVLGMPPGASAQAPDDGFWTWALPQVAESARSGDIAGILERARQRRAENPAEDARGERDRLPEQAQRGRRGGLPEQAQRGRRGEDHEEYEDERYEDERYRGAEDRRRGEGPPFCRNGEGHPVHGWQWCVEKGWARDGHYDRGRYQDRRDGSWLPTRWEDVIIGAPTPRRSDQRVAEPTLADILGGVIMGRLAGHRDRIGASGDLNGRWLLENGARILQVRAGGTPLAELSDLDADGRADAVLLSRGR